MTPKVIGKYEVVRALGRGAMGVVYLARDPRVGRDVAIKTLALDARQPPSWRARFLREAEAIGRLSHPGIVQIYRCDIWEGQPYIAMEYLGGSDLTDVVRERPPRSLEHRVAILVKACDALHHAHERGVVHRDLKPANIRVLEGGRVKLMDFGLARLGASSLTKSGVMMGTIPYMSPEHISARTVDARSDIFSMGSVAFELLTGRRPFPGEDASVIVHRIGHAAPRPFRVDAPGSVGTELAGVVMKALEKTPGERYQTAAEMADALRRASVPGAPASGPAAAGAPPLPGRAATGYETVVIEPAGSPAPPPLARQRGGETVRDPFAAVVRSHLPRGPVLLHEVLPALYRALLDRLGLAPRQRARFFAEAGRALRAALVEAARTRGTGSPIQVALSSRGAPVMELLALHEALSRLEAVAPEEARVVELRLFGGLGLSDVARHVGRGREAVERLWACGRARLVRDPRSVR